jgi:hypothetical protein
LVPLRDVVEILAGRPLIAFFQIVGNLLVFAAVGFGLGLGWQVRFAWVACRPCGHVDRGGSTAVRPGARTRLVDRRRAIERDRCGIRTR